MKSTKTKKNHKIRNTAFLLFLLVIVFLAGIYALIMLRMTKQKDMSYPYDISSEMTMFQAADGSMDKAVSFASDLCVTATNKHLDGIEMRDPVKSVLFDINRNEVLFAQNPHEKTYPASITKIMTALVAMKYGNLDDIVTIPATAVQLEEGSSEIGFQPGDQTTLDQLLYALLIYSGNDAAMAIAEHVGGTVDQFVALMNEETEKIGATKTHFVNPSGLHDPNHYTTAYDVYLMLNEAIKNPHFVEIMQLSVYNLSYTRGEEELTKRLDSTDQYLTKQVSPPKDVIVLGGKTGTTSDAGSCLALVSQNKYGELFISVVLKAPTKASLYNNMNQLLGRIN